MGYDLMAWAERVQVRLSRHNDERDQEDNAAFAAMCRELDTAVARVLVKPEYERILDREEG